MDSIRPISSLPPVPAVDLAARVADSADRGSGDRPLEPAVSLDVSPAAAKRAEAESRGFERDRDSKAMVYRVTDTFSGDVIVQIPNEIVIKARAYGRQDVPSAGQVIEKRA